jgi:hypothetical protein
MLAGKKHKKTSGRVKSETKFKHPDFAKDFVPRLSISARSEQNLEGSC